MPLISQNCLNRIRQQVALADVVAPYVQLKPCGRYLKGLSPFSNEKTPSFFVDPQRNTFKCFSSGHAGDLFRFLELKEQLTFTEAVEWICEKFSIPIEYASSSEPTAQSQTVSIKKQLFEVYAHATQFFVEQFWANAPHALQAQQYWIQARHFQLETARTFQVGWAPIDGTLLYQVLRQQHFSHELLAQSGLFFTQKTAHNATLMSRFQGRLMLPISDIQGRTIAFSGRAAPFAETPHDPTRESKYINSPETPIFIKGHTVFHLHQARQALASSQVFYLVEGPLDVIRCWECGLKTAVAPQGTGLTVEQLNILKRYDVPLIGMFDGDAAGIHAGIRLMTLGLPLEIPIRYYLLNPDEDPDSAFLKQPQRCTEIATNALSPVAFFVQIFHNPDPLTQRRNVLKTLLPIIAACASELTRFDLLNELANTFAVPQSILLQQLQRIPSHSTSRTTIDAAAPPSSQSLSTWPLPGHPAPNETLETQILQFLFHAPQWTPTILQHLRPYIDAMDATHTVAQLLVKILNEFDANGIVPLDNRDAWKLSAEENETWCQTLAQPFPTLHLKQRLTTLLNAYQQRLLKSSISKLDKQIQAISLKDTRLAQSLYRQRFDAKRALQKLSVQVQQPL